MSSEAAQKAYPEDEWSAGANAIAREAFDAGAVEALRQAQRHFHHDVGTGLRTGKDVAFILGHLISEWEVGQ